jgi:hypothetical protein
MGVIKRFAIWSMVLGTLAMAGGASALAFGGGSGSGSGATVPLQVQSDPVGDVVPAAPVDNSAGWAAPHSFRYDPSPID